MQPLFLVKCCLLATTQDTFGAPWPLSLIWDLEADATAPPRGRRVRTRRQAEIKSGRPLPLSCKQALPLSPAVPGASRPGFLPNFSQLFGWRQGLSRVGIFGQTAVWLTARAGLGGRGEEAECAWGRGHVSKGICSHFHSPGTHRAGAGRGWGSACGVSGFSDLCFLGGHSPQFLILERLR